MASATQPSTTPVAGTSATSGALRLPRPQAARDHCLAAARLTRELAQFIKEPVEGCTVELAGENIFQWTATITGPRDTPYEGGTFQLALSFGHEYPFKPPDIYFLTRVYHCNVAQNGYICMDILKMEWSPALTVPKVLLSIISFLSDPNPNDPMQPSIAKVYKKDHSKYIANARAWTDRYAKAKPDREESQ